VQAVPSNRSAWSATRLWGGWIILLHYLVGRGQARTTVSFNPVATLAGVLEDSCGADRAGATVRAAQFGGLALGWRLFERYLIAAGGLESIPVQDLRDGVTALNRRIGRRPAARTARTHAAGHRARVVTTWAGRAATGGGVRLCARTQVRRRRG
jgi:hypothetical protein